MSEIWLAADKDAHFGGFQTSHCWLGQVKVADQNRGECELVERTGDGDGGELVGRELALYCKPLYGW